MDDEDRLYYMHMEKGISEFDIFEMAHEAWYGWGGGVLRLEGDFDIFMFDGVIPDYVIDYVGKYHKGKEVSKP